MKIKLLKRLSWINVKILIGGTSIRHNHFQMAKIIIKKRLNKIK